MAVPVNLRPSAISFWWENFTTVETPLERFFPMQANQIPGPEVRYDITDNSRERPRVNTREGPPNYLDPEGLDTVLLMGETWRDGRDIDSTLFKDTRRPGSVDANRQAFQVGNDVAMLRRRY